MLRARVRRAQRSTRFWLTGTILAAPLLFGAMGLATGMEAPAYIALPLLIGLIALAGYAPLRWRDEKKRLTRFIEAESSLSVEVFEGSVDRAAAAADPLLPLLIHLGLEVDGEPQVLERLSGSGELLTINGQALEKLTPSLLTRIPGVAARPSPLFPKPVRDVEGEVRTTRTLSAGERAELARLIEGGRPSPGIGQIGCLVYMLFGVASPAWRGWSAAALIPSAILVFALSYVAWRWWQNFRLMARLSEDLRAGEVVLVEEQFHRRERLRAAGFDWTVDGQAAPWRFQVSLDTLAPPESDEPGRAPE